MVVDVAFDDEDNINDDDDVSDRAKSVNDVDDDKCKYDAENDYEEDDEGED